MSAQNRNIYTTILRPHSDFYPTPIYSFEPLLDYLPKLMKIWEPACGDRRLINFLNKNGFDSDGNDIKNGYNFLEDNTHRDCIVTNPPFSLAQEFISHSISLSPNVYMLLRINFLGTQKRLNWWKENVPSALFILSKRPSFTDDGMRDATEYAWFYWGEAHFGLYFIDKVN